MEVKMGNGKVMRYRNKPFTVDAVQWQGSNIEEVEKLIGEKLPYDRFYMHINIEERKSLELGDYLIKSKDGKFYVCDPHDFEIIYEEAE